MRKQVATRQITCTRVTPKAGDSRTGIGFGNAALPGVPGTTLPLLRTDSAATNAQRLPGPRKRDLSSRSFLVSRPPGLESPPGRPTSLNNPGAQEERGRAVGGN